MRLWEALVVSSIGTALGMGLGYLALVLAGAA